MAETDKVLGQVSPSASTWMSLYRVPAATQALISRIYVYNSGTVAGMFSIACILGGATIIPSLNKQYMITNYILAVGEGLWINTPFPLAANDRISVEANITGTAFQCWGVEITGTSHEAGKILGQLQPNQNTWTTLYTVPTSTQAIISLISICNVSSAQIITWLGIIPGATGGTPVVQQYLLGNETLYYTDTILFSPGLTLNAGDSIVSYHSGVNGSIAFQAFGVENS